MHPRAQEFSDQARRLHDIDIDVHEFPDGTKTAADAAAAIGCDRAQIASSLVFVAEDDPVVVVTSGANRVSERKLAEHIQVDHDAIRTADPDEVRTATGWSIGGVPPFCHEREVPVYLDDTLTEFETVWAAAGTPQAVFPIAPERIRRFSDAEVVDVAE